MRVVEGGGGVPSALRLGVVSLLVATVFAGLGMCATALGDAEVRRAVETAPSQDVGVTVAGVINAGNFAAFDRAVRTQTAQAFGGAPSEVTTLLRSDGYAMPGQEKLTNRRPERLRFDSFDGFQQHARLIGGAWPRPRSEPVEVAISQAAASLTGFTAGQVITTVGRIDAKPVRVKITGVFVPDDPYGPRWAGDLMLGRGVEREGYTTYGPLMVDQATFLDRFAETVDATWTVVPDLRGLPVERLRTAAARLPDLRERFKENGCPDCTPLSALPGTLARIEAASEAARWTVLGVAALLALALLLAPGPKRTGRVLGTAAVVMGCALVAPFVARPLLSLAAAAPWWRAAGLRLPDISATLPVAIALALVAAVCLVAAVPRPGKRALSSALAAAVAVFAICAATTWRSSQLDQARHQAGADLRLTGPPAGGEPGVLGRGTAFTALPGVTAAVPGHRDRVDVDLRYSTLLGVDANRLGEVFRLRPDLSDRTVPQLAAAMVAGRPEIGALPLPGQPRTLTVEVEQPDGPVRLRVVVSDALGVWHDLPVAPLRAGSAKVDVDLAGLAGRDGKIAYPLVVRGFLADATDDSPHVITVTALRADGGELALPTGQRWSEGTGSGVFSLKLKDGAAVARLVPLNASPARPVPIVLTADLAASAKLATGRTGTISLGRQQLQVELAGVVERLPGAALDPAGVLMDWQTLQAWNLAAARPPLPATDWWLAVDGDGSGVRAAVARSGWDVTMIGSPDPQAPSPAPLGVAIALALVAAAGLLLRSAAAARWGPLWAAAAGTLAGLGLCYVALPRLVPAWQGGTVTPDVVVDVPWPAIVALPVLFAVVTAVARPFAGRSSGDAPAARVGHA
ncbi:hypothetical protein AB0J35_38990 [Nonomuraea angiospora]|uniref:hypothetical protein n=1 Tax=Nonomuraea angiospora TaxID=46172 RepID=UPI00341E4497